MDGGRPFRMPSQDDSPARKPQPSRPVRYTQAPAAIPHTPAAPAARRHADSSEVFKGESPSAAIETIAAASASTTPPAAKKGSKRLKGLRAHKRLFIRGGIALFVVVILGWILGTAFQNAQTAIDPSKYQAVFFTNGQVYFGKLKPYNASYLLLTDVYYLKNETETTDNPQSTSNSSTNVKLIKLGEEIHGPLDEMVVTRDQVLFYENLSPEGKVVQSIEQYKRANS